MAYPTFPNTGFLWLEKKTKLGLPSNATDPLVTGAFSSANTAMVDSLQSYTALGGLSGASPTLAYAAALSPDNPNRGWYYLYLNLMYDNNGDFFPQDPIYFDANTGEKSGYPGVADSKNTCLMPDGQTALLFMYSDTPSVLAKNLQYGGYQTPQEGLYSSNENHFLSSTDLDNIVALTSTVAYVVFSEKNTTTNTWSVIAHQVNVVPRTGTTSDKAGSITYGPRLSLYTAPSGSTVRVIHLEGDQYAVTADYEVIAANGAKRWRTSLVNIGSTQNDVSSGYQQSAPFYDPAQPKSDSNRPWSQVTIARVNGFSGGKTLTTIVDSTSQEVLTYNNNVLKDTLAPLGAGQTKMTDYRFANGGGATGGTLKVAQFIWNVNGSTISPTILSYVAFGSYATTLVDRSTLDIPNAVEVEPGLHGFNFRAPNDGWLWGRVKYANGVNQYQYVGFSPNTSNDFTITDLRYSSVDRQQNVTVTFDLEGSTTALNGGDALTTTLSTSPDTSGTATYTANNVYGTPPLQITGDVDFIASSTAYLHVRNTRTGSVASTPIDFTRPTYPTYSDSDLTWWTTDRMTNQVFGSRQPDTTYTSSNGFVYSSVEGYAPVGHDIALQASKSYTGNSVALTWSYLYSATEDDYQGQVATNTATVPLVSGNNVVQLKNIRPVGVHCSANLLVGERPVLQLIHHSNVGVIGNASNATYANVSLAASAIKMRTSEGPGVVAIEYQGVDSTHNTESGTIVVAWSELATNGNWRLTVKELAWTFNPAPGGTLSLSTTATQVYSAPAGSELKVLDVLSQGDGSTGVAQIFVEETLNGVRSVKFLPYRKGGTLNSVTTISTYDSAQEATTNNLNYSQIMFARIGDQWSISAINDADNSFLQFQFPSLEATVAPSQDKIVGNLSIPALGATQMTLSPAVVTEDAQNIVQYLSTADSNPLILTSYPKTFSTDWNLSINQVNIPQIVLAQPQSLVMRDQMRGWFWGAYQDATMTSPDYRIVGIEPTAVPTLTIDNLDSDYTLNTDGEPHQADITLSFGLSGVDLLEGDSIDLKLQTTDPEFGLIVLETKTVTYANNTTYSFTHDYDSYFHLSYPAADTVSNDRGINIIAVNTRNNAQDSNGFVFSPPTSPTPSTPPEPVVAGRSHLHLPIVNAQGTLYTWVSATLTNTETGLLNLEPVYSTASSTIPLPNPAIFQPGIIDIWTDNPIRVDIAIKTHDSSETLPGIDVRPEPTSVVTSSMPIHITGVTSAQAILTATDGDDYIWGPGVTVPVHYHDGRGSFSTSLGTVSQDSTGPGDTAIGDSTTNADPASSYATSFGYGTESWDTKTVTLGAGAAATHSGAVALGQNSDAGHNAVAIGYQASTRDVNGDPLTENVSVQYATNNGLLSVNANKTVIGDHATNSEYASKSLYLSGKGVQVDPAGTANAAVRLALTAKVAGKFSTDGNFAHSGSLGFFGANPVANSDRPAFYLPTPDSSNAIHNFLLRLSEFGLAVRSLVPLPGDPSNNPTPVPDPTPTPVPSGTFTYATISDVQNARGYSWYGMEDGLRGPNLTELQAMAALGFKMVRLPVRYTTPNADIAKILADAETAKIWVGVDVHNYGRINGTASINATDGTYIVPTTIKKNDGSTYLAANAQTWYDKCLDQLTAFKGYKSYVPLDMNEPAQSGPSNGATYENLPVNGGKTVLPGWEAVSSGRVNALRSAGWTGVIGVSAAQRSSAGGINNTLEHPNGWWITDSNTFLEVHHYTQGLTDSYRQTRTDLDNWAKTYGGSNTYVDYIKKSWGWGAMGDSRWKNVPMLIGEYGMPPGCEIELDTYLTLVDARKVGAMLWAGGMWNASYPWKATDTQYAVIQKHIPNYTANPTDPTPTPTPSTTMPYATLSTVTTARGFNWYGMEDTLRGPILSELQDMVARGYNVVRLPVRWDTTNAAITQVLSDAVKAGIYVIVDMHNYGRIGGGASIGATDGTVISSSNASQWYAKCLDQLNAFKGYPSYIPGDQNEPSQTGTVWEPISKGRVDALRNAGWTGVVLVSAAQRSSAGGINNANEHPNGWWITDNNAVLDLHHYLQPLSDSHIQTRSELDAWVVQNASYISPQTYLAYVKQAFYYGAFGSPVWKNVPKIITEFAMPPGLELELDAYMTQVDAVGAGAVYWAGGMWSTPYPFNITDAQKSVLSSHVQNGQQIVFLTDNYATQDTTNAGWSTGTGVSNNRAYITLANGPANPSTNYRSITYFNPFSGLGSKMQVNVIPGKNGTGPVTTVSLMSSTAGTDFSVVYDGASGKATAGLRVGYGFPLGESVQWDYTDGERLSVEETGGKIFLYSSLDNGATWTKRANAKTSDGSWTTPSWYSAIQLQYSAYNAGGTSTNAYFYALNSTPPARTIADDFEQTSVDTTKWVLAGTPTISNGALQLDVGDSITSRATVDLSSQSEFFNITGVPAAANSESFFRMMLDENNALEWAVTNGVCYARIIKSGVMTAVGQVNFNATTTNYLQIRGAAGRVYFEYGNGTTYTSIASGGTVNPFNVTALNVRFGQRGI